VPDHRLDVGRPVDLIEEVARVHGYDRMPGTLIGDVLPPLHSNRRLVVEETARDALVRAGLQEIVSYRLTARDAERGLGQDWSGGEPAYVEVLNPISPERSVLRRSILTGLLESGRLNARGGTRVALFELGPVFEPAGTGLPREPGRLGILLTGTSRLADWRDPASAADFYHLKGVVDALAAALGVALIWRAGRHGAMHPGRTAVVAIAAADVGDGGGSRGRGEGLVGDADVATAPVGDADVATGMVGDAGGAAGMVGDAGWGEGLVGDADGANTLVGHVGELHPLLAERREMDAAAVLVADLDFDTLIGAARDHAPFAPFSAYPAVREDLAVVVTEDVVAEAVADVIRSAGGDLLTEVRLFDVYRGASIPDGTKSLAWALTYQSPDRTLTGDDAAAVRERIVRALAARLGATVRAS
jgi:phenylalanyl-tRNA synthetase beta chain